MTQKFPLSWSLATDSKGFVLACFLLHYVKDKKDIKGGKGLDKDLKEMGQRSWVINE